MDDANERFDPETILAFWFEELTPRDWWSKDAGLDARIAARFGRVLTAARAGELAHWREPARGRLAEILVLDQFPRNVFRDRAEAFASDGMALVLAQEAVRLGVDRELPPTQRAFLYLPYMHSESLRVHDEALRLFDQPGLEENLRFEHAHRAIIARFGRYPHRNEILGRPSTAEELAFLREPGSSF